MNSIWNEIEKIEFPKLQGHIKTDVLIVGGGMCGILCAYMLKNAGVDCVLVEADRILSGITNATTAKITFQHGLIYHKIIKKYGKENAYLYYESQKSALDMLAKIASEIHAELEWCSSFVYSVNNRSVIEKEVETLESIGCNVEFCTNTELPFDVAGAVRVENQAKFHPLKFGYGLARNLQIYEKTQVLDLRTAAVITDNGSINAKKVIVATHFPFINKHGLYFLKMYQHRSYVLALENAQTFRDMYVDEQQDGLSFRNHGSLLLLGGGSHRTGSDGGNWKELREFAQKYYPDAQETSHWATQDCMTLDSVPYIGQYSKLTDNLYVATGFNKWGMTSSMVSAMVLSDLICRGESKYKKVYSPSRTMLHPQLAVNVFESVKGLLTPRKPRCPHMGCVLKYNKQEHSWDCPCHGSRFDKDGKLIDNPATKGMSE